MRFFGERRKMNVDAVNQGKIENISMVRVKIMKR